MKKQFAEYRWLAGGQGLKGSLWEGPDHLLVIEGRGFIFPFKEIYRRLDYKNIQAISMAKTSRFIWLTVLLLLIDAGLFLGWLAAFSNSGATPGVLLFALVPLAVLVWLCIHLYLGDTCKCSIQTAVLFLPLRPLRRRKVAQEVLERLHQAALRHQGEIPAEALMGMTPPPTPFRPVGASPFGAAAGPIPFFAAPPKPLWPGSRTAQVTMGLLLLWGLLFAGKVLVSGTAYLIGQGVLAAVVALMAAIVLAQLKGFLLPKPRIRIVLWLALITITVAGLVCFVMLVVLSASARAADLPEMVSNLGEVTLSYPGHAAMVFLVFGLIAAVLGASGLPGTGPRIAPEPEVAPPAAPPPAPPPSTPANPGSWPS